jgi:hypothetical protein
VAIDDNLPLPVVNFLNVIGVPWPYINEGAVREFASVVREFRQALESTHDGATSAVAAIARAYESVSAERMQSGWKLLSGHMGEVIAGLSVLEGALEAAAAYIVVQKGAAIAELVGMAAAFFADQAASVATLGLAELAEPAIIWGARKLMESLEMDLQQYLVGELIGVAAKPLFAKVAALPSLDLAEAGTAAGKPAEVSLYPGEVREQTRTLRELTAKLHTHVAVFQARVEGLRF